MYSNKILINYCKLGKLDNIKELIYNNPYINIHINNEEAFICACENGHIEIVKYLIDIIKDTTNPIDIHIRNEAAFRFACWYGKIEVVKYLIDITKDTNNPIDIHIKNEEAFRNACYNGHIKVVKYLIEYSKSINSPINIHIKNEESFRNACENGHIKVVKYLIEYSNIINSPINIHIFNENAFIWACRNGRIEVIKYLVQLDPDNYSVVIKNNKLISYKINDPINVALENEDYTKVFRLLNITNSVEFKCDGIQCLYCHIDEDYGKCITFNCNNTEHMMHIDCAYTWYSKNIKECLLCKTTFTWDSCSRIIHI